MENDVTEHVELPYYCKIKVHRLMCLELNKFIDRISHIFSAVESARPRCTSGIQALCLLHVSMDKAKLLIQHCSESSKLYLAFTADKILLRCEKIRNNLELYLSQIQNLVPTLLAAKPYFDMHLRFFVGLATLPSTSLELRVNRYLQISGIIDDLRKAKFHLESSEDEAGKVLALLLRDMSASGSELEALQLVALRLNITSPLALLVEKRSIKRLHDSVCDAHPTKKKILKYFYLLLRKYGELILRHQTESIHAPHEESYYHCVNAQHVTQADESGTPELPEEFKCPISMRLMYDPVVIASGKTFERVWIEKWFNEGHQTCPITHMSLDDHKSLTPNSAVKGLISKWCLKHGITISEPHTEPIPALLSSQKSSCSSTIASFGRSLVNLRLQTSNVSFHSSDTNCRLDSSDGKNNDDSSLGLPRNNANSHGYRSSTGSHGITLDSLSKLVSLSWSSKCKAVEYVKDQLKDDDQACSTISSSGMMPLIKFLEDAHDLGDIRAERDGAEVLLAVLSSSRIGMPPLHEDAICLLATFLDSEITDKALEIMEVLSCQLHYRSGVVASGILPSILKLLDTQIREFHKLAIKILCNLSGNNDIGCHLVYLDFIPKLVPFLDDPILAGYCIKIIKDLCNNEEARTAVSEANLCITSIARLLETGTKEQQEHAVEVLLILCYEHAEYCQRLVTTESIIPSLFDISVNGNSRAMMIAMELLQLLGQTTESDFSASSVPNVGSISYISSDSGNNSKDNKSSSWAISGISSNSSNNSKDNKSSFEAFRFLGKKISRFFHATH